MRIMERTLVLIVEAVSAIAHPATPAGIVTSDWLGVIKAHKDHCRFDFFKRSRVGRRRC
jgi:hypothetical protein